MMHLGAITAPNASRLYQAGESHHSMEALQTFIGPHLRIGNFSNESVQMPVAYLTSDIVMGRFAGFLDIYCKLYI